MKKIIVSLLLLGLAFHCSAQSTNLFDYDETFTGIKTKEDNIVFGGTPRKAFLTANPDSINVVKDAPGQGYLRLTSAENDQKGYIYCTKQFSSAQGFAIEFEYFTYAENNGGADGITFFMFDAKAANSGNFSIGGFGGSLGYAPYNLGTVSAGLSGAYIGVGIDEYGNFKMLKEGRSTGIDPQGNPYPTRNSLTIRGPEPQYAFVKSVETLTEHGFQIGTGVIRATDPRSDGYRKVFIEMERIDGDSNNGYYLTVKMQIGGTELKKITLINKLEYKYAPPAQMMYGIASSTGESKNFHEIRNVRINRFNVDVAGAPRANDDLNIKGITKKTISIDVLKNDTAAVGHTIPKDSVFVEQPQSVNGGRIAVDPVTGQITYRPKDGYYGNDSFTYYVKDDQGLRSNVATVFLTVKKPPVGKPSFFSIVIENETQLPIATFDLKKAYTDLTGLSFPQQPSTFPKSPNFIWKGDGTFTYRPVRNTFEDSFYYQIMDADSLVSDSILVSIKVLYKPVAKEDVYYVTSNAQESFNVGVNDYDKDTGWDLAMLSSTAAEVNRPKNATGDSRFLTTGYYLYTSIKDFVGVDDFTYTLHDEPQPAYVTTSPFYLYSDPSKVTVNVYPKPKIGTAKSASFKEAANSSYDINYKLYIKNLNPQLSQFAPDKQMTLTQMGITEDLSKALGGQDFTIKSIGILGNTGTLFLNPNFTGKQINAQDEVSTQLLSKADSKLEPGASDSIQIVINVKFDRGIPWSIDNQIEAKAEFELLSNPLSRVVRDLSYNGIDPENSPLEGKTTITLPVPEKPEAKDVRLSMYADDVPLLYEVILNNVTAKGGKTINRSSLIVKKVSGTNVDFSLEPDFRVKFTQKGIVGFSVFSYSVKDELGVVSDDRTIIIEVKPIPTGVADEFYTLTNKQIDDLHILKNDGTTAVINTYDIVLDAPGIDLTANTVHGSYTYIPPANQYGQYNFSYKLRFYNDLTKVSPSIPVIIYVNNPPTAVDKDYKTAMNSPITLDLASLGTDVDGLISRAPGSVKIMNADFKGGTFVEDATNPGSFIFKPKTNFTGTVAFRYTVEDNFDSRARGISEPQVITIEVGNGVVQPPANNKIGVAKHMAGINPGPNGSFDVRYLFTIKNYGQEVLNNVGLTDDLGLTFNDAQFTLKSLTAQGGLVTNNSYNGFAFTEILDKAKSSLQPGASATVEMIVNVKLLEKEGIFINTAIAEAQPAGGGAKAVDQSTSGLSPDPGGNGDVSPKDPTLVELLFPRLFIPGGFSPNNDGTNDKFIIRNIKDKKIAIEVFNRWGNRVFKSGDYQNDWDGRCTEGISLGQDLPPGTYFYIIIFDGKDKFTGHITLNR